MFSENRRLLWFNIILMLIELTIATVIVAFYFGDPDAITVPGEVLGSCFTKRRKQFTAVWAPPLVYESYMAGLAIYKIFKDHALLHPYESDMSLLGLMIRDNVIYFVMTAMVALLNIFLYLFTILNPGVSSVVLVHAAGAVGGTRLILNLRGHAVKPDEPPSRATNFDFQFPPELSAILNEEHVSSSGEVMHPIELSVSERSMMSSPGASGVPAFTSASLISSV